MKALLILVFVCGALSSGSVFAANGLGSRVNKVTDAVTLPLKRWLLRGSAAASSHKQKVMSAVAGAMLGATVLFGGVANTNAHHNIDPNNPQVVQVNDLKLARRLFAGAGIQTQYDGRPDEEIIGWLENGDLTDHYLLSREDLRINKLGISDTTGMEYLDNLRHLYMGKNKVSDLSFISTSRMPLETLWAGRNHISDLSPLAGETSLQVLGLAVQRREGRVLGSPLKDISPLANLTNLVELKLQYNNISDISALSGLTNLRVLHLEFNAIKDASPLVDIDHPDLYISLDKNFLTEESKELMRQMQATVHLGSQHGEDVPRAPSMKRGKLATTWGALKRGD